MPYHMTQSIQPETALPYPVHKPIASLQDALDAKRSASKWIPGEMADDRLIEVVAFRLADLWATYPPQPGEPAQLPYLVQSHRKHLFDDKFRRRRLKRRLQHPLNPLPYPRYELATCSNILGSLRLGNRFRQAKRARFEDPAADALNAKMPKSCPLPYDFIRRAT